jgi:hypothetical protein
MAGRDEDPERVLRRSLEQIEDAADLICRGIGFFDPDCLESQLDTEVGELRGALARLMGQPADAAGAAGADLGALASGLAGRVCDGLAAPPRLEVARAALPPAAADQDALCAAVSRLLLIGVTHAGSGGVVTLGSRVVDGDPALQLVARPAAGEPAAALLPPTTRCASLADFARRLGGSFELVEGAGEEIAALLRFPRTGAAAQ